jgi:hypothetical protein
VIVAIDFDPLQDPVRRPRARQQVIGAPNDHIATLLALAKCGRPRPAIGMACELLEDGWRPTQLIVELFVPVQEQVGALWETGRWTTADEHAASAVASGVLGAISQEPAVARAHRGACGGLRPPPTDPGDMIPGAARFTPSTPPVDRLGAVPSSTRPPAEVAGRSSSNALRRRLMADLPVPLDDAR